jgi:anti-repressor protein
MQNFNETKGLQAFFYDGIEVRTIQIDGETWWVAKDVCEVFGGTDRNRSMQCLDNDEKGYAQIDTPRGPQKLSIVNESGLYSLLLAMQPSKARGVSEEYIAKREEKLRLFKRWVTHEVLPQIRKHGAYVTSSKIDEILNAPEAWIKLLTTVKEERIAKERLQIQIEHDRPKIIFADAVSVAETDILIGELAKILKGNGIEIGPNRLFERLRQDGFLIRRKGTDYNTPTQKSMELGLFRIIETAITHSDGHITISKTAKVTGKGQQYFVNLFLNSDKQLIDEELTANTNEDEEANHGI